MKACKTSFSFGENWQSFLSTVTAESLEHARKDIEQWLGPDAVKGKTVLDVGCGSGIHSLSFHLLEAREVISFDLDPKSVAATRSLWEKAGKPASWTIMQGSILDQEFLNQFHGKTYDLVYSWGCLHHTGAMWEGIDNSCRMVKRGGWYWISLYAKGEGRNYARDLALKQKYNASSKVGKKLMEARSIVKLMRSRYRKGQNPFGWNERIERGMTIYHDIVDWLGGLPYEVASVEEVTAYLEKKGFTSLRIKEVSEGGCSIYLFSSTGGPF
jgi:2-polyprenyl-6-hydroxyphenyl methylase/3-demethylubiquinone-9 3-methyltransferase